LSSYAATILSLKSNDIRLLHTLTLTLFLNGYNYILNALERFKLVVAFRAVSGGGPPDTTRGAACAPRKPGPA
jgi:hypothetical protein